MICAQGVKATANSWNPATLALRILSADTEKGKAGMNKGSEPMNPPNDRRLCHGDIVAVSHTTGGGPTVGRIDRIHWDCDPVWISMIDVDTGEWCSAQLPHVIGRLEDHDSTPRLTPEPPSAPPPPEDPPGIGLVLAS